MTSRWAAVATPNSASRSPANSITPPTELERVAYRIEQEDHRGTFYFAQMNTAAAAGSKGLIGFHGAGGGGSMMSMDAITNEGFTIANFCDTSGNPSPAKVYRAARIILSQPGLIGYFGSGSGIANQEQYWSAYGLAKAFWELELSIPAVIRLGGNTEDRAADILHSSRKGLPAIVECYKKNDPPARIAARFAELVSASSNPQSKIQNRSGLPALPAAPPSSTPPPPPPSPSSPEPSGSIPRRGKPTLPRSSPAPTVSCAMTPANPPSPAHPKSFSPKTAT